MPSRHVVASVEAVSDRFVAFHGLDVPSVGAEILLDDAGPSGAFGEVTPILRIDGGRPRRPLRAKVMFEDHASELVRRIRALIDALEREPVGEWADSVLALSYCVLGVTDLAGVRRTMTLMIDLGALEYGACPFCDDDNPDAHLDYLDDVPEPTRHELALRFAERAAVLERIGYVHADINAQNVMMRVDAPADVQIIDLDSGALPAEGIPAPLSAGKVALIAPELAAAARAARRTMADPTLVSASTDLWNVGVLMAQILCGIEPLFFLSGNGPREIEAYARDPVGWPEVDPASGLLSDDPSVRSAYDTARASLFDPLPAAPRTLIRALFAAGLDGGRRPHADAWHAALRTVGDPPRITVFAVDETYVLEGSDVEVTWDAADATYVVISPDVGRRVARGSERVVVERSMRFTCTAVNAYGESTALAAIVRVLEVPHVRHLDVPRPPALNLAVEITLPVPGDGHDVPGPPALSGFFGGTGFRSRQTSTTPMPGPPSVLSLLPPAPRLT
jgi:hypothetical protein